LVLSTYVELQRFIFAACAGLGWAGGELDWKWTGLEMELELDWMCT
jgi:hypothetical protein